MDACNFYWEKLIDILDIGATLFTAFVALWIYKSWREQKGSEVVANEANQLSKDLLSKIHNTEVLISKIIKHDSNIDLSHLTLLEIGYTDTLRRMLFIHTCIVINDFDDDIERFQSSNEELIKEICNVIELKKNSTILKVENHKKILSIKKYNTECIMKIIKKLQPYTVFKNKITLRKIDPK